MQMVDRQILRRGVNDAAVLAAMRTVPRHQFIREQDIDQAYEDHPLSIGHDQTISQPYIVGSMTQELQLDRNSRVLEIGTGCGYQTTVLAEIVQHVYSIECIHELLSEADKRLVNLGYDNVTTITGDGSLGWAEHAPFDGILVAAAARSIPPALTEQLAEGGRMVIPLEISSLNQELMLVCKTASGVERKTLYGVRFVPLKRS